MSTNVYGLFTDRSEGQQVMPDLSQSGFNDTTKVENEGQIGQLNSLGIPQQDIPCLAEGVRRGGMVIVTSAYDENMVDRAVSIMQRHHVSSLNDCMTQWKQQGWQARDTNGQTVIPVVEEQLQIGKRQVDHGGVRIHSRIEEKPIEQQVQLREERVTVDRHKVDRPASESDFNAAKQGDIEITETVEEPVVAKQARVVEEVTVGKQVNERTETVRDTVRRTDVEVEQLGSDQSQSSNQSYNQTANPMPYRTDAGTLSGPAAAPGTTTSEINTEGRTEDHRGFFEKIADKIKGEDTDEDRSDTNERRVA